MTLHLFNPSHDEALAFGAATYCPGSAARRMSELLWDLPRWWKEEGDEILRLPPDGSLRGVKSPDWGRVERIMPWGWDAHIVRVLQRLGAPARLRSPFCLPRPTWSAGAGCHRAAPQC